MLGKCFAPHDNSVFVLEHVSGEDKPPDSAKPSDADGLPTVYKASMTVVRGMNTRPCHMFLRTRY